MFKINYRSINGKDFIISNKNKKKMLKMKLVGTTKRYKNRLNVEHFSKCKRSLGF